MIAPYETHEYNMDHRGLLTYHEIYLCQMHSLVRPIHNIALQVMSSIDQWSME